MGDVEITYSIVVGGEEVGFGSSGHSEDINEALHVMHTEISLGQWERPPLSGSPSGLRDLSAAEPNRTSLANEAPHTVSPSGEADCG